jgi:NAD(P)-dependent dehydrogenase (short-subunit alcohol dehydrogenase family)
MDLAGKVVLVTGGNSGIGFAIADGLATAGADVVIWGRRAERNELAAERLRVHGGRVSCHQVDVADEQAVNRGFGETVKQMGRVDAAIANAGIVVGVPEFEHMHTESYLQNIRINQFGATYTLRAAAEYLMNRVKSGGAGGSLVGVTSISAFVGIPGTAGYSSAKGAIVGLIRTLAVQLAPYRIRANCIAPGWIKSELGDESVRAAATPQVERRTGGYGWADPDVISGAAIYLASDASSFHTGDVLVVDGGYSLCGY